MTMFLYCFKPSTRSLHSMFENRTMSSREESGLLDVTCVSVRYGYRYSDRTIQRFRQTQMKYVKIASGAASVCLLSETSNVCTVGKSFICLDLYFILRALVKVEALKVKGTSNESWNTISRYWKKMFKRFFFNPASLIQKQHHHEHQYLTRPPKKYNN